jgi:hypothetical protein
MTENLATAEARRPDHASVEPEPRHRGAAHFLRHLVEMVLAMIAGMMLLGPVWDTATAALGAAGVIARPDVAALVMATNMTVGMSVWMRHRRHGWAAVAEMGAAMYVPILALLVPFWTGAVSGELLMLGGHVLMLPAMVVAMAVRRDEYTRHVQVATAPAGHGNPSHGIVAALKRRWPTWLALLVTVDNWVHPTVLPAWSLVILPVGYLVIGFARKALGDPRLLALQIVGLLGYLVLVMVGSSVDAEVARYVIGAGWLAHSVWDIAHHRMNKVVPRGYAEWCAVVDAVIGLTIIFLL